MRLTIAFAMLIVSCSSGGDDTQTQADDLKADFDAFVEANNSCATDTDCALVSPGCPLGCYAAVSTTSVDATEAKAEDLVDQYESGGRACNYLCQTPGPVRCEEQRCTIEPAQTGGCTLIGCIVGPAGVAHGLVSRAGTP